MSIDLQNYETVDERISRFYGRYPQGRITTELVDMTGDVGKTRWVVKAQVFRDSEPGTLPAGEGYAFEVDGAGMANLSAALENCETSAIGRALAQAGLSGNRRTTANEMAKVVRHELQAKLAAARSVEDTRRVWWEASRNGLLGVFRDAIFLKKKELEDKEGAGSGGAVGPGVDRECDTAVGDEDREGD